MNSIQLKDNDSGKLVSLTIENNSFSISSDDVQTEDVLRQVISKVVSNYYIRIYDESGINFIKELSLINEPEEFLTGLILELRRYGYSVKEADEKTFAALERLEKEIKIKSDGLAQESFEYPV